MPRKKKTYYEKLLFVFTNAAAFMPLIMVPFGLLVRQEYVDSRFYTSDLTFATLITAYMAVGLTNIWYSKRLKPSLAVDIIFAATYHILTLLFVLFVSGFLSAFLAMWIVLMISADLRFGLRGFLFSFIGLATAGAFSLVLHPEMPVSERIEVLQGTIVVGAIGLVIARIRSITDRERSQLSKTREKEVYQRERLIALVNSMGDAVVATDERGVIKLYNSTLLNLLDTNLDLIGEKLDDVLKLQDGKSHAVKIVQEATTRKAIFSRSDLSYQFSDGELMHLYINVAPIQGGYRSRAENGFIFILRDITKEKTLEEERDEFVSVVSHELRTPVTIAEGNLSNIKLLFERGADQKLITDAVAHAHEQVLYLAKLVNDLSTLARAERGTAGQAEDVDVNKELQTIFTTYAPEAELKKLALNLDATPSLPKVHLNLLYLQEILQNLVTNALKYTREGSITIKAAQSPDGLLISVSDTGIGISKTDQKHIFEKFYRSEDYRTRESSGTGLGLYVCLKLAQKMGLKLGFESRLNFGSTFTITIPPAQFADAQIVRAEAPAAPIPGSIHSAPSS